MTHPTDFGHGDGVLHRAAALVTEARHDLAGTAVTLDGQVATVRGRWGGAGAEAFFGLHRAWAEQHARIVGALDGLADALTETERDNTRVDDDARGFLADLTARLGAVRI
ncbi:WXG100 family type VII secretion target [Nocardioides sp. YIM 152588]|uniref:WXG100 family type VII secretion target n=1 Tax=Nocardioides sp. YIM 152588 TaxID=3158259 RepID=UPI0032E49E2B